MPYTLKDEKTNDLELQHIEPFTHKGRPLELVAQTFERPLAKMAGRVGYSRVLIWDDINQCHIGVIPTEGPKMDMDGLKELLEYAKKNIDKHTFLNNS